MKIILITLLVIVGVLFALLFFFKRAMRNKADIPLKKHGIKMLINLEDCEIVSRVFNEEIVKDNWPTRIEMMDSFQGKNSNMQSQSIQRTASQVKYSKKDENGELRVYVSQVFYKSKDLILYRFIEQKVATIYIDPLNKSRYYFDLDFLYS